MQVSIENDGVAAFDDMYEVEFVSSSDAGKVRLMYLSRETLSV